MRNLLLAMIFFAAIGYSSSSFATIYGTPSVCGLWNTTLAGDSIGTVGGTWSSSNPSVATVVSITPATCKVTGISYGSTTLTYTGPSGASTVVFNVYPYPTAIIGGGTHICIGATTTFTHATSGGTWSSAAPAIATVGISTGIISGVSDGGCFITYTVPTGCFVFAAVHVDGPPTVDSLIGMPTICPGSSTTYSGMTTGGGSFISGIYTSSNPSVATVGSTSGVVTGVSVGTSIISYTGTATCGSGVDTATISVTTTISAGTLSGMTTIPTGGSTFIYPSLPGGTWSSSNPAVATVTTTGYVAGVSTGTAIITYTITSGSCAPGIATIMVTVAGTDCISGNITCPGIGYYGNIKVWLIKYNPTTLILSAVDSVMAYSTGPGTVAPYSFCGMGTDSFRVKAGFDTVLAGTGYIPTYHTASAYWNTATVIPHIGGTADINKHIYMAYGTTTAGPGFIAGDVTTGANKGTVDGAPVPDMLVYCVDITSGNIIQTAITNAAGHYSFSNLAVGVPYRIYPEDMNYGTTPYPPITLTTGTTSFSAASFIQHTVSYTITPILVGIDNVSSANAFISIHPNPAKGMLNVQWSAANAGNGTVVITDVTGRQVLTSNIDMSENSGNARIELDGIKAGLYMVTIRANGVNYNAKIVVE